MAGLLARLKLRLLRNALRSSTSARVSFIISTTFAVLAAAGIFAVLALQQGQSAAVDLTTVIFTVLAFGWLILPLLAFGLDSTLDPATLALYPVRTRPLAVGLLAASATGAWPLANLIGLLGVTIGLARGVAGLLIAVIAVVLQVLFCITLARFVTTGMARMLRSRRGKDLAALMLIPIFGCYELFTQVVPRAAAEGKLTAASFAGVDEWLRWLPSGLAAHAIADASAGRAGVALLRLALLAAVIVALGWLWIRSLGRALVTADSSTQSSRSHDSALPFARYGLRGTALARFLIYQRRDPAELIYWGVTAIIMVTVSVSAIASHRGSSGVVIASAVFGAAFVGAFHSDSIGATGPGFLIDAMALTGRRVLRAYLSGQNLALAAIAVPLLAAVSFGLAAAVRDPMTGFPATAAGLAGLGAALGLGNIFSVLLPYPTVKRAGSPMRAAADGYTAYGFGGIMGSLIGVAVLTAPVIVAAALTSAVPAVIRMPALLACAAAYGLALAWAGVRIAAAAAMSRLPELCQIAVRSQL
jgi:ABC-2 type transport system permease protein